MGGSGRVRAVAAVTVVATVVALSVVVGGGSAHADGPVPGPPPPVLDATFGDPSTPGEQTLAGTLGFSDGSALLVAPDGGILAAGFGSPSWIERFRPDGSVDTAFAAGGRLDPGPGVTAVVAALDGTLLVSRHVDWSTPPTMERYTAAGRIDSSFGDGSGPGRATFGLYEPLQPIGSDALGRIYALYQPVATQQLRIRRLSSAGLPDASYGVGGEADPGGSAFTKPHATVDASGRVMVAVDPGQVVRFGADGRPDAGFGAAGRVAFSPSSGVESLAVDTEDRVLVADGRGSDARILRFGSGGAPAPFAATGSLELRLATVGAPAPVSATLLPTPGGGFAIAGAWPGSNLDVVRFLPDGHVDPDFNALGGRPGWAMVPSVTGNIELHGVAVDRQGRVLALASTRLLRLVAGASPPDVVAVVPERLLDTRPDGPRVAYTGPKPAAGATIELAATGVGVAAVPADATAVVLNVTATEAIADGFVTIWPCGSARPTASNLNLTAGATVANLVFAKLGERGRVCLYTQSGTHLIADLVGYVPAGTRYRPVVPVRLLDTRPGSRVGFRGSDKPLGGLTYQFFFEDTVPLPATASSAMLNVTGTEATDDGYVVLAGCTSSPGGTSTLNLQRGTTRANMAVAAFEQSQRVCFLSQSGTHLVVDLAGWFVAGSSFRSVQPTRLLDTRDPSFGGPKPGPGAVVAVGVAGRAGSPVPVGATSVLVNVTATEATQDGFVTAWPCDRPRPLASTLNVAAGGTVPNLALVKLDGSGRVCLYTHAGAHLLADVVAFD